MRKIYSLKAICATALAVLIYACSFVYFAATAQDVPQSAAKPSATPAPKIDSAPVIVSREYVLEAELMDTQLKLLVTQLNGLIPEETKKKMADFEKEIKELQARQEKFFIEKIKIPMADLKDYERQQGQNGDVILRKKAPEKK